MNRSANTLGSGAAAATAAYILWGVSSLYWRLLGNVAATELVAYRILMSLVVLVILLVVTGTLGDIVKAAADPRNLVIYTLSGLSVAANWAAFMWGSIHGHLVETGLGYLMAPLMNVAFGTILLKEAVSTARIMAIAIMVLAIGLLVVNGGELNAFVYGAIAVSFGVYSFLRKLGPLGPIAGLALESAILSTIVFACGALGLISLTAPWTGPGDQLALLLVCGIVSVGPLWLFSVANRALPLSTLGFFQYLLPTTQFVLAVWLFGQTPSRNTVLSLGLIWVALAIVLVDMLREGRRLTARVGVPVHEQSRTTQAQH